MKTKNWIVEEEEGQGIVEYALILALIAIALIASTNLVRESFMDKFNKAAEEIVSIPS